MLSSQIICSSRDRLTINATYRTISNSIWWK